MCSPTHAPDMHGPETQKAHEQKKEDKAPNKALKARQGQNYLQRKKETKKKGQSAEVPYWNFLGLGLVLRSATLA